MNTTSLLLIGLWLSCSIIKCYSIGWDPDTRLFIYDLQDRGIDYDLYEGQFYDDFNDGPKDKLNEITPHKKCPVEFTLLGEKCYYIQTADKKSLYDAVASCNKKQSSLANIGDDIDSSALAKHIFSIDSKIGFWISNSDNLLKEEERKSQVADGCKLCSIFKQMSITVEHCRNTEAFVCETDPQENQTDDSSQKEQKDIKSKDTITNNSGETPSTTVLPTEKTKPLNDNDCPKNFIKLQDKCYYIEHENRLNWFAADRQCKKMNSYITTIENVKEMADLNEYLSERHYDKNEGDSWGYYGFWTGGNNLGSEGEFNWVSTGEEISYTHWYQNEPNNVNENEHCMEIGYMDYEYFMNDRVCDQENFFICKTEPRQEAPSTTPKVVGICEQFNLMRLNLEAESSLIKLLHSQQQCPKSKA